MEQPKYKIDQQIETQYTNSIIYMDGTIVGISAQYTYRVRLKNGEYWNRTEAQIREPRPSPEEAWEKATMLIGMRAHHGPFNLETWHRETRHQVYQILGAAGIKMEPEVKADVRRLIEIADKM